MDTAAATQRPGEGLAARAAGVAARSAGMGKTAQGFRSAAEFGDVLEATLEALEADERVGPRLRATGFRLRLSCPDIAATLDLAAADGEQRYLRWSFGGDGELQGGFELSMDSDVANGYLQGAENLPIAIARGRVRCHGETWSALRWLPVARPICASYREVIAARHPHLLAR